MQPPVAARIAIGAGLLLATGAVVLLAGVNTTSAVLELVVFAWGIAAWVVVGRRRRRGGPTLRHVAGTDQVDIDQRGEDPLASHIRGRHVRIRQRSDAG